MKRVFLCFLVIMLVLAAVPVSVSADDSSTVIAFGDSITAAGKWQKVLEDELGIKIINKGVGGDSTRTARTRFKKDVLNLSPDLVIISFGTNDAAIDMDKYTPLEDYKQNLAYYIDSCLEIGAKVMLNIPIPIDDTPYLTRHEAAPFEPFGGPNGLLSLYAEAAREVADEKGVRYADVNEAFLKTDNYKKYISDGIHPNDAGYKLYGKAVLPTYRKFFLGDITGDFSVSAQDYALAKRHCLNTYTLTEYQQKRGDVNGDGTFSSLDYGLIKRICLGTYEID